MASRTWRDPDGPARRWWRGAGGAVPEGAERLLRPAAGGRRRWASAGRAAGPGVDQVAAEALLGALVAAGLVEVRERRNRRGDWEPYEWRLTAAGAARAGEPAGGAVAAAVSDWLAQAPAEESQPLLESLRAWLEGGAAAAAPPTTVRLALAIGAELRAGRRPRGRLLAVRVAGHTKAVRLEEHRAALEQAFGQPLEEVVPPLLQAVLVAGPLVLRLGAERFAAPACFPWLALPPESVAALDAIETTAERLLTVENLLPFEDLARAGLPPGSVALYTGGFPGRSERAVIAALVRAGVRHVDHWGDLDLGGLRILRRVAELAAVPVRPWRMEPALLARLPTRPLTERDRAGLEEWLRDPAAPARDLAAALLGAGVKAEQEGWFLTSVGPPRSTTVGVPPPRSGR